MIKALAFLRQRWRLLALSIPLGLFLLATALTQPPRLPDYTEIAGEWQPSEAWLHDRAGRVIDTERVNFQTRRLDWLPFDQISPAMTEAIVSAEDHRFFAHDGVDFIALANAAWQKLRGERGRGASTISMQLAAFLEPSLARPGARSWRDKVRQMRAALALEDHWSKSEILAAYLNLAPFRGENQGVGAASLALLGKPAKALTRQDALLLTALLPNPSVSPEKLAARACRLGKLTDCGAIRGAAANMLSAHGNRAEEANLAPHLATRLLTKPGMHVTTTLDSSIQQAAITALRRQLQGLGPSRARDGAVVVLDNASGEVLAYVGGVGLGSTAAAVDGANAYRQAGSTLKPFLYGQVIEHGWLTAASILDDSPVQLDTASGLYVPQNYDHSFKGPVSVRSALAGSLNVPAVRTLLLAGVQPFRDRLWDLGYHGLTEDGSYYGFSLALGSAEVTLLEQANAYRALANGGRWSALRLRSHDRAGPERAIMSPGSAWIVADILSDASARTATFGPDSALRLPFWAAAKTGTSKAMRDNWCVGFSDRFTVAVWVGNLEGDSMKSVSGTSGAAPVWRDVMMALHEGRPGVAPPRPDGIEQRRVAFDTRSEPPRMEWFLHGTGQSRQASAPDSARRPRIVSPASGSVYALDPDIPIERQWLGANVAGLAEGYRLRLDARDLGDAAARPQLKAGQGSHVLALLDPVGREVDRVRFTIR